VGLPSSLAVFVPAPESRLPFLIAAKSGIVGSPDPDDATRVVIDYDGDLYHAANVRTYADRVRVAAGRHKDRYPTVARRSVPAMDLVQVGWWLSEGFLEITDMEALTGYRGTPVDRKELLVTEP